MSNRLLKLVSAYLDSMDFESHGSINAEGEPEGDLTVYGDGERLFDTFDDFLSIQPKFLRTMEGLFGDDVGNYIALWFSKAFDWEVSEWDEAEFYDDDDTAF